ncbi:methyl-accepting chemotaxis protein [Metabacillus fastidiosus]|uniref:methyl-accepting chemotaxis protein n=1 Tax=Metabacillus fastidiosus TaxID=1458 RepID=UPI003D2AEAED
MKITRLIKILIILTVTLSIISLINLTLLFQSIQNRTKAIDTQIEAQDLVYSFMNVSDFLTSSVRSYIQSGELKYYDEYWKEVTETKTRETTLEQLKALDVPDELISAVGQATEQSKQLAKLESAAMDAVERKNFKEAGQIAFGNEYNTQKASTTLAFENFGEKMNTWANAQAAIAYNKMLTYLISTIVFIFILVIFVNISLIFLHRKIQPLQLVTALAERVSNGDLNVEQVHLKSSKDEVSQLAKAFNLMTTNLKTLVKKIKDTSEQVSASSEELSSSSEQNSHATEEVAATMQMLAAGAERQVHSIKDTSLIIEQILASSQQIAGSTEITLATVSKAAERTNSGNNAVQTSVKQMGLISENVSELENIIKNMGEHSSEIGQIIAVINNIAEQTNLLALNAAIEAARAGESGRGFAIVADEVRKLAELSAQSTKQIAGLIHMIQAATNEAVISMELTAKEVSSGIELVNTAGCSFNQINSAINEVTAQIEEISSSVQQLSSGTEHVVHSIKTVELVANEASSSTQSVSAATEEQLASTEEITASASSLSKMADDLQTQIGIFKL